MRSKPTQDEINRAYEGAANSYKEIAEKAIVSSDAARKDMFAARARAERLEDAGSDVADILMDIVGNAKLPKEDVIRATDAVKAWALAAMNNIFPEK